MTSLELQLKTLIKFLQKEKIKYAILGGIAVSFYGEPRLTSDIDVNIMLEKSRINEVLEKIRKYGFSPLLPNTSKIAFKSGVIPLNFKKSGRLGRCDIIIAENILEYNAIRRSRLRKLGQIKAKLLSAEDLIIHKIASSRPRDAEDLKGIIIRQRGKLDVKYITYWLKKIDKVSKNSRFYKKFSNLMRKS